MSTKSYTKNDISIFLSIFVIAISLFVYQVVLTRIYSVVLYYHYVFLITSFAIFGLGIGSILAYKLKQSKEATDTNKYVKAKISKGSRMLVLVYAVVFLMIYLLPYSNSLLVYTFLGTIPFIIGGYIYSIIFMELSLISGRLYFADLIGSGIGSVMVLFLLNDAGMFRTILFVVFLASIPVVIIPLSNKKFNSFCFILPVIIVAGLFIPGRYVNSIEKNFRGLINNPHKTYGKLAEQGLNSEIVFSEWNAFSRTDVLKVQDMTDRMVLTIDGAANSSMYAFDGNMESLEKFKKDLGFIPFAIKSDTNKTLLIGSGGGKDVIYALAGESKDISAVEINTSSIHAVKAFSDYNGNIYNRPEVKVYAEDGRSFVQRDNNKYDTIFLSLVMTNASQGIGYALSENYIYTVEAISDYLNHLNAKGKIAFLVHDEKDLSKIVTTAIQALSRRGIPEEEAPNYLAVFASVMSHGDKNAMQPLVIVKNTPFSETESEILMQTARAGDNHALYLPFLYEDGILKDIKESNISLSDFIKNVDAKIAPATDDSPYFYNNNKGIPPTLLIILFSVVAGTFILFRFISPKDRNLRHITYSGLLGIGFMMVEVPLIQKFILYLGHPVLAFTYILAALLIGSGLGGFFSNNKIFNRKIYSLYLPAVMAAVINIVLLFSLDVIFESTFSFNTIGRIIIACTIAMIQGFFMGMPFPRGLKIAGAEKKNAVPIMWGMNGVMSIAGSVLSVILSMNVGFTWALAIGAIVYLIISRIKI